MAERKESARYTLYGDLDGITVARLREMLDDYPLDAVIDVRSENLWGSDEDEDFFVFTWEE